MLLTFWPREGRVDWPQRMLLEYSKIEWQSVENREKMKSKKKKNPILLFSSLTNKHPKDQNYVGRRHCTQYLMVGFSSIFEMLGLFESCLARHSFIHNKIFLWRQLTNNVVILERKLPTPSDGYTHIKMKAKKQPTSLSFTWYYCLIFPAL